MIKFRIHPKIWEGEVQIWKSVGKCRNYRFLLNTFWDILDKIKDNFGKECVKGNFYSSMEKLEQLPLISMEK